MTNSKFQINSNIEIQKFKLHTFDANGYLNLNIGAYLLFEICNLEFSKYRYV